MNSLTTTAIKLLHDYPLVSDQMTKKRLEIIMRQLAKVLDNDTTGDIVEFGCYVGTTSLYISRLLKGTDSEKLFYAYDSFSGLPPKTIQDASVAGSDFKAGELKASKRTLISNYKKAGLPRPIIHKGWFGELQPKQIPATIAFAFLDGDFYNSIIDSLALVWPRLSSGGVIIVDDYNLSNLPGVTRAIEDFFKEERVKITHQSDLAIISKP